METAMQLTGLPKVAVGLIAIVVVVLVIAIGYYVVKGRWAPECRRGRKADDGETKQEICRLIESINAKQKRCIEGMTQSRG